MRVVIWGIGKYYRKYCHFINQSDVLFLTDGNEKFYGKEIDGKIVMPPHCILEIELDYVVILVKNYVDIKNRLIDMGITKIMTIDHLSELYEMQPILKNRKASLYEWIERCENKKIMICIPGFGRSGVPIAGMNLAVLLKKMNYAVVMVGLEGGLLEETILQKKIDYIDNVELFLHDKMFKSCMIKMDYIIVCSIIMNDFVNTVCDNSMKILWWIHESDEKWYESRVINANISSILYFGVGYRVLNKFAEMFPTKKMENLFYYLPDEKNVKKVFSTRKRKFAVIGSIDKRKAQDIFLSAIKQLGAEDRKRGLFYIVGAGEKKLVDDLKTDCEHIPEVVFKEEMSQDEISAFYNEIDILVCPSRDDPMPIVVSEAMQRGIPCVVSNQVGQSQLLDKYNFGKVFESENIDALREILQYFLNCKNEELNAFSIEAERLFNVFFSEKVMIKELKAILDNN